MARWVLVLAMGGCSGKDDDTGLDPTDTDTDTGTPTTDDTGDLPLSPELVVLPEHLYSLSVDWSIESTDIREGADALVSWGTLGTDAWGLPIDEISIPVFALIEVLYPPDQVAEHLAADDFGTDLLSIWELDATGEVFANLSELTYESTPFDPVAYLVPESGKTWLAALAYRDGDRLDVRTLKGFQVGATAPNTSIDITDTSSAVTWSAAFDGTALATTGGQELYTVDWVAIETDAHGKAYDPYIGDVLFIGRFDGKVPADLGTDLVSLELAATQWFTMDVERETDARLDLARDGAGTVFGGFTAGGTWVIGVECTTCLSPFPLWAAVVEVD